MDECMPLIDWLSWVRHEGEQHIERCRMETNRDADLRPDISLRKDQIKDGSIVSAAVTSARLRPSRPKSIRSDFERENQTSDLGRSTEGRWKIFVRRNDVISQCCLST